MTTEDLNFKENLKGFLDILQHAFVNRIVLYVEISPTFDQDAVPFKFDYSFSTVIATNNGNFKVIAAATSEGTETFWIKEIAQITGGDKVIEIGSDIKSIEVETAKDLRYPFKISMLFDNKEIFLYCGEIYDNVDGKLKYNFNDEMILVFDERQEAMKFETLIKYG